MAVTSQNGYSANDRSVIASLTVPGSTRKLAVRAGDVSVVLLDLAAWIHAHIRPIDTGVLDDWGYAERTIRGSSTTLSNHASGTAIDLDALLHPLGVTGTWSADDKRRINARLAYYDGVVRWGENYTGRLDGMHFEINAGSAAVRRVADKIRAAGYAAGPARPTPSPKGLLDMIERRLVKGSNVGRVACPTGSASELVAASWVSVSIQGGASGRVLFQRSADTDAAPPGTGEPFDFVARNAARPWKPIPSGTEFIEYFIDAKGEGSLLIEQKPK
jgi:hypothetical protein